MPKAEPGPQRLPASDGSGRQPGWFARTPPAIFPPILGLLGLSIALWLALGQLALPLALADLLAGIALALWAFATFAYGVKAARRPGVVVEDLRLLPGRAGLAAMTMGGMAGATLLAAYAPGAAMVLLVLALASHAVLALLLLRLLLALPPPGRAVNPTWHLSFVGFIVAAPAAVAVGWTELATALFWLILPVPTVIWSLSAVQFLRSRPPPPQRPLLALHLAPVALFATVAGLLGLAEISTGFLLAGLAYAVVLGAAGRWMTAAGVTPMWGGFTFPLAALASALLRHGWEVPGLVLTAVGLVAIPAILWWVLRRWPGGRLAAATNAAEA
jgi:tellurite resistance protein